MRYTSLALVLVNNTVDFCTKLQIKNEKDKQGIKSDDGKQRQDVEDVLRRGLLGQEASLQQLIVIMVVIEDALVRRQRQNTCFGDVCVVFMSAWTGNPQTKYVHHGKPKTLGFGHLFSGSLLGFEPSYICFASARLRFMYSAKSLELIGDFCDSAIFRILRLVTSLWNWLMNVMVHILLWFPVQIYIFFHIHCIFAF